MATDPVFPPPRAGRVQGAGVRLGYMGDTAEWKLITDLYYWDKVEEAYQRSLEAGALGVGATLGFFRLVEGEALTRRVSEIEQVNGWLTLEMLPEGPPGMAELAQDVCLHVSGRLGWNFEARTMVSVLVPDADVPWHSARYGYMMDKYPYDKVCLPAATLEDESHLRRVLAHEYAHVITLNLTLNRAPHWVEEGISTLMEGPVRPDQRERFRSGASAWLDVRKLDGAFEAERRNGENRDKIRDAYSQAQLLVEYLYRAKGDEGLKQFLRAYGDNSVLEELKIRLGADPTDEALRQVFGIDQKELFEVGHAG